MVTLQFTWLFAIHLEKRSGLHAILRTGILIGSVNPYTSSLHLALSKEIWSKCYAKKVAVTFTQIKWMPKCTPKSLFLINIKF